MPVKGGGRLVSYPSKSENIGVSNSYVSSTVTLCLVNRPRREHTLSSGFAVRTVYVISELSGVSRLKGACQPANRRLVATPVALQKDQWESSLHFKAELTLLVFPVVR